MYRFALILARAQSIDTYLGPHVEEAVVVFGRLSTRQRSQHVTTRHNHVTRGHKRSKESLWNILVPG